MDLAIGELQYKRAPSSGGERGSQVGVCKRTTKYHGFARTDARLNPSVILPLLRTCQILVPRRLVAVHSSGMLGTQLSRADCLGCMNCLTVWNPIEHPPFGVQEEAMAGPIIRLLRLQSQLSCCRR
jgi:hypothetical protein